MSVYPAAFIPIEVADRGMPMVIINQGRTDHDGRATVLVDGPAGSVLPELVDRLAAN
jgi:NAD-dependent SIR2 family protein deacetylase